MKYFRKAASIDTYNPEYKHNIGLVLFEMKKYQEAVLELKRVIRIAPNNADVYHNLGQIFEKTKDYQDAINTYQEFLKIKGADWENKSLVTTKK